MPIVFIGGRAALVCANREHPAHADAGKESTMEAAPGWHALLSVEPPTSEKLPNVNDNSFLPVKIYACGVCGYVEMYAAGIAAADIWRRGK